MSHFWLDSDLDVEALREDRRRLLAICSWRFSLASCKTERTTISPLNYTAHVALLRLLTSNHTTTGGSLQIHSFGLAAILLNQTPLNNTMLIRFSTTEKTAVYLHPLGQQLGVFCGLVLVLQCTLLLHSNASALVLQHTWCYQTLNLRGLGSGLLAYQRKALKLGYNLMLGVLQPCNFSICNRQKLDQNKVRRKL